MEIRTAILIDGGYYRKRAAFVHGKKDPDKRAQELYNYCYKHLFPNHGRRSLVKDHLYRIFYYDCPPIDKQVFHPLSRENIDFSKSDTKKWSESFFASLSKMRKVALRLGSLNESEITYQLSYSKLKSILSKNITVDDLTKDDFSLSMKQKGVDMMIGIDIASMAFKKQVDKIILIAGDSDFVPAAKLARREGIDFILDSLGAGIKPNLSLHIDGRRTCDPAYTCGKKANIKVKDK